jgi:hypothetical protein
MLLHPGAPTNPPSPIRSFMERATFDYVVREVLGIADDDLLLKALDGNGIASLPDLITLSDDQIDTLSFDAGSGPRVPSLASRNKVRILRSWNFHLQLVQGRRLVDWMESSTVNEDEWEDYRVGIYLPVDVLAASPTLQAKPAVFRVASQPRSKQVFLPALDPITLPADPDKDEKLDNGELEVDVDGELDFDEDYDDEALEFDDDDVPCDAIDSNAIQDDPMGTCFELSAEEKDSNIRSFDILDFQIDCCGNDFLGLGNVFVAENVVQASHGIIYPSSGPPVSADDRNILVDCCVQDLFAEANLVFDPGGGDCSVFRGFCDFPPPTPKQYFDLLLLDRGEL